MLITIHDLQTMRKFASKKYIFLVKNAERLCTDLGHDHVLTLPDVGVLRLDDGL